MPPRSPELRERDAALALALAPGVGSTRHQELMATFGSASQALATRSDADRLREEVAWYVAQVEAVGAMLWVRGAPGYPAALDALEHPPLVLTGRGDPAWLERPGIAMVGTRDATPYGTRMARELAHAAARAGAVVVSGLARGIDAAAHRAALEAGGGTIAVLGTGVDVAYPTSHRALLAEVAARGLVLSERPPGARATPGSFPARNRIIAALARVTIVVEAGRGSGALITATEAAALGREVMAVPGPLDAPQSLGCHQLVRDGAYIVTEVDDVLHAAGLSRAAPTASASRLEGAARAVWEALARGPLDADGLAAVSRLPARTCLASVTELELAGLVECAITGEVRRRG